MTTNARITRSIAKPVAQRMHTAWMTAISMTLSPAPMRAPSVAKTRSVGSTRTGPMARRPRKSNAARAVRARKPTTPATAVGIPATAEYGLSLTREQLKYELTSHHVEDAA